MALHPSGAPAPVHAQAQRQHGSTGHCGCGSSGRTVLSPMISRSQDRAASGSLWATLTALIPMVRQPPSTRRVANYVARTSASHNSSRTSLSWMTLQVVKGLGHPSHRRKVRPTPSFSPSPDPRVLLHLVAS
ncbi:UNVERIFIED_CONTAM: hypothetical protein K2H54_066718 [Gekko kuhli]